MTAKRKRTVEPPVHPPPPGMLAKHSRVVSIAELLPDPDNRRVHGDKNRRAVLESLREFGQVLPVLVKAGSLQIIGGNCTWDCMRELGFAECWVVEWDGTPERMRLLATVLNRAPELAEWDYRGLWGDLSTLRDTFNLENFGWDAGDLEPLSGASWEPPPIGDLPGKQEGHAQVRLTREQAGAIRRAVTKWKKLHADAAATDGAVLAAICREWEKDKRRQ